MERRSFLIRTIGGLLASGWMSLERVVADKKDPPSLEQLQPAKQEKKIEYTPRENPCLDVVSMQVIVHCSECKKPVPFAKWRYDRRRDVYHVTAHCHNSVAMFSCEGRDLFKDEWDPGSVPHGFYTKPRVAKIKVVM